jgi:hypothetical protein
MIVIPFEFTASELLRHPSSTINSYFVQIPFRNDDESCWRYQGTLLQGRLMRCTWTVNQNSLECTLPQTKDNQKDSSEIMVTLANEEKNLGRWKIQIEKGVSALDPDGFRALNAEVQRYET